MDKSDLAESAAIITRTLKALLGTVPNHGQPGSALRRACGDLVANAAVLLRADEAGEPMAECFDLARLAGTTINGFINARDVTLAEVPATLGGKLTKHSLVQFSLTAEARVIADTTFTSRQDVAKVRERVNEAFAVAEETTADAMDSMSYRALVELHSAIMFYLVETARPLPRLLRFAFAVPLPTLVAAHRLYDDAARADEMRDENKVVHPAFMRPAGLALSA